MSDDAAEERADENGPGRGRADQTAVLQRPDKSLGRPNLSLSEAQVHELVSRWHARDRFLVEMLQDVQEGARHLPLHALHQIAREVHVPLGRIYHLATFFKSFSLHPRGEHEVRVCLGTACHVKASVRVLEACARRLDIEPGQTTPDGGYSLESVRCLGCCGLAAVMTIDDELYGHVTSATVGRVFKKFERSREEREKAVQEVQPVSRAEAGRRARNRLTVDDLRELRETLEAERTVREGKAHVMVCAGTGCVSNGSVALKDAFERELGRRDQTAGIEVVATGCMGFCAQGPIVLVQPDGIFYQKLKPGDPPRLVEEHLLKGCPVKKHMYVAPQTKDPVPLIRDIPFFRKQVPIALRNRGLIDPERIEDYIARDGYQALVKVVTQMTPQEVIAEIKASALRGRGGGGFPTGIKWESCRKARSEDGIRYVLCNAAAFMNRSIIESDPHSVVEGMCIGAYAIGAREGYVYVRHEYSLALRRLLTALDQARAYGLLGANILGTDFSFDVEVHRGAGAYVCGEGTALMASVEGRVGEPRFKYVHSVEKGLYNRPSCLNNVETWANVPPIILRGARWFTSLGTGDVSESPWGGSKGTKVFSLAGKVNNIGLVEVPMDVTLREIIYNIGGGIRGGKRFKAVQTGGPLGGCLPERLLDLPVDFDSLVKAGSIMGSGELVVMDEHDCMINVARYFIEFLEGESCGKCTPCREGLRHMGRILNRICEGRGHESDPDLLEELSANMTDTSLCALGGCAPNPVLSTLKYFRDEYDAHIRDRRCPAGVCKALITYSIDAAKCTGCTLCAKACPAAAISGEPKQFHVLDPEKCDRCGTCYDACTFEAIIRK
jgi:NADH:ubiquinone oxidoreductase subunit F (NADH-binding)/NADH:ubiquinone oxidoreductase subunit E